MAADFSCMRVAFLVSVLVCLGFNKKISSFYCFHFGNCLFVRTEKNDGHVHWSRLGRGSVYLFVQPSDYMWSR